MKLLPYLVLCVVGLVACDKGSPTQPPSDPFERWKSYGLHNYTIDQKRSCFCPNGGQKMRLTITSDTVSSVVRIADGIKLSYPESQAYYSIDYLFAQIQHWSNDSLVIRYNDEYGYPEFLDLNPQLHQADVGVLYETTNLRVP